MSDSSLTDSNVTDSNNVSFLNNSRLPLFGKNKNDPNIKAEANKIARIIVEEGLSPSRENIQLVVCEENCRKNSPPVNGTFANKVENRCKELMAQNQPMGGTRRRRRRGKKTRRMRRRGSRRARR